MGYRLHIRRMRQPGIYWHWNPRTKSPEAHLVDYASRDDWYFVDYTQGINLTDRSWRKVRLFGVVVVVSWPACSYRR